MARRFYSSTAARTTLATGVDDSTTTLSVAAVSGWPTSFPYTLIVDQDTVNEEIVEVSARSGTTLTVTRGVDGTSAVAHSAGAAVQHGVSARDFDGPNAFINGTGTVTETLLATGAVTEAKLGDGAVTSAKIFDGTIVNADINASAAIAQSKIADLTSDLASKLDLAGGKILQIVRATDSTDRSTTSATFVDASISVTITPQKDDSAVLLIWTAYAIVAPTTGSTRAAMQISDSSDNGISGAQQPLLGLDAATGSRWPTVLIAYSTPATISATTYKGRFRRVDAGATFTLANSGASGQLYAIEVSA
jgi:hypothetical protein